MIPAPRLLAITPGDGRDLTPWLLTLGAAGLGAVLIREPHLDAPALRRVVALAERWIPLVIVHDKNPHAARLGRPLHGRPGPGIAGVSCHDARGLDRAFAEGASYALLSPVWSPASKPTDRRPTLGLEGYLAMAADRPVLALGGVDGPRLRTLRARGAWGGALMGCLFGASTPDAAAAALLSLR